MSNFKLEILGTESLGVRGLSCIVDAGNRKIIIDPGIALGYKRYGLLPHPVQVGVGEVIRGKIIAGLKDATDIVFSHYHGDHIPFVEANPYQLSTSAVNFSLADKSVWAKNSLNESINMEKRTRGLALALNISLNNSEGKKDGILEFSKAVPHDTENSSLGKVMMTVISSDHEKFVHASDIQFFNEETVDKIIAYDPTLVLASGPSLYLGCASKKRIEDARNNALKLARSVNCLVIDHHLLRDFNGLKWLKELSKQTNNNVICAAEYMNRPPLLLEAMRKKLYKDIPVPSNWHKKYGNGQESTGKYINKAKKMSKLKYII
ncbi:MAG: MBL fold metallo-hydrolase [Clostridiales bacterium]|nr:MBL fold metallo-hydrolase [Clostridiales bacterium]MCF8022319.1 MBL fold metallo-hydrolase [Clostridiales bacterium]